MRPTLINMLLILILLTFVVSCGSDNKMVQAKKKTAGGLPAQVPQMSSGDKAKEVIKLTENLIYPGSKPYETAKYDYVSGDNPDKVCNWFETNLKGSVVNKMTTKDPGNCKYTITFENLIIDILPGPHGADTLIRYKMDIKTKKAEDKK